MTTLAAPTLTRNKPEYRRLDAPFGGEILGLDLSRPVSDELYAWIRASYLDAGVLIFRDQQDLTPEQHIRFSRLFGPLQIHVLKEFHLSGHPEILVISNIVENGKRVGLADAGRFWHSDLSYKAVPSLGSLLHARELPNEGGDTLFADMALAYEALDPDFRRALDGAQAWHSYLLRYDELRAKSDARPPLDEKRQKEVAPVLHPVVRTHPETGRPALFVSEAFTSHIEGWDPDRSRNALDALFAHSIRPEFVYRHRWQDGDLVFWDNRRLIHLAAGTPEGERRKMFRTTIEGDVPR